MTKRTFKMILEEAVQLEESGVKPREIYFGMTDEDRERVFRSLVRSAAYKTSARVDNPLKLFKLVNDNLEELTQSANLRFLESVQAGQTKDKNGIELNFLRLVHRACNNSVTHAWREIYSHPTAAESIKDSFGNELSVIDIYADPTTKRPPTPDKSLLINETISEVISLIKPYSGNRTRELLSENYRADAMSILKLSICGYTQKEMSKRLNCSEKRITRIKAAIAEAAEEYKKNVNGWAEAAREVIEALAELYEN